MLKLKNSTILVGLSLSEQDNNLMNSAANLAQKTNSQLVLAHAILPFQAYAYAGEGAFYPLSSYENTFRELSEVMGLERLEELKASISEFQKRGLDVSVKVVHNDPALGLSQLAKDLKASVLICGFQPEQVKTDYFGMSTAILLMSEAPCPVLALPLNQLFTFSGKLAFADDLQDHTLPALETSCEFLRELGLTELVHVHVNNISERDIDHMTETIKSAMLLGKIPSNPDFDRQVYIDQTTEQITEILESRFKTLPEELRSHIKYQAKVGFGPPAKKTRQIMQEVDAELVAFGTHKFFDRSSWRFGKMPYHAMVAIGRGLLIVPDKSKAQTS